MIYLCYFILLFTAIRFVTALVNFLSFKYLPEIVNLHELPKLSILIPARNEEANIGNLLQQLSKFTYTTFEIIVYNDKSTDKTADIINKHIYKQNNIKLINGVDLPENWLGKNHACHQLAKVATGDIFLFLDADVSVKNGLIERALTHLQKQGLHLLSIFPKQISKSTGEKISVPLMNWILLSLLPMVLIRKSQNPAFSAANGQFMLFKADSYRLQLPHELFRMHKVEDIETLRHFKKQNLKVDTLLGNDYIKCRMYTNLNDAIDGFTKNIFQFFGNSIVLTILVALLTTLAPLLLYLFIGIQITSIYICVVIGIRMLVSLASKQSVFSNLLYMIPQHIIFLVIITKGIIYNNRKKLIWKGRNIL